MRIYFIAFRHICIRLEYPNSPITTLKWYHHTLFTERSYLQLQSYHPSSKTQGQLVGTGRRNHVQNRDELASSFLILPVISSSRPDQLALGLEGYLPPYQIVMRIEPCTFSLGLSLLGCYAFMVEKDSGSYISGWTTKFYFRWSSWEFFKSKLDFESFHTSFNGKMCQQTRTNHWVDQTFHWFMIKQ